MKGPVPQSQGIERILVIKMRYIGDTLLVTPLLRSLKKGFSGAQIDVLVNKGTQDVLFNNPCIRRALLFDYDGPMGKGRHSLQLLRFIRKERYDMVIELTGNDRGAFFSALSGAAVRVGYRKKNRIIRSMAYTHIIDSDLSDTHAVDHHLSAAEYLHVPPAERHPFISVTGSSRERIDAVLLDAGVPGGAHFVIIHPSARRWYKRWPIERFAALGDRIFQTYGMRVLVSGGNEDREIAGRLAGLMNHKPVNLAGKMPLLDFPALLERARCVVGNDSAPIHIATAVRTPAVALFGPTLWETWGPRREHDRTVAAEYPCRPCGHGRADCPLGEKYCMSSIDFADVWKAVEEIMGHGSASG